MKGNQLVAMNLIAVAMKSGCEFDYCGLMISNELILLDLVGRRHNLVKAGMDL